MKSAFALSLLAALTLSACSPPTKYPSVQSGKATEPPVQREQQAYLQKTAQDPVNCSVGADCTAKWSQALEWVNIHSQYSIKTSTDSEITTYGPIEPTTDAAFTISRTPVDSTSMAINFSATCGEHAACVPTVLELNADFKNYLLNGVTHGDF